MCVVFIYYPLSSSLSLAFTHRPIPPAPAFPNILTFTYVLASFPPSLSLLHPPRSPPRPAPSSSYASLLTSSSPSPLSFSSS
ncbi:hypothetical protein DFH06DRAFT_71016 [Mycena polygramma]|nr:hypothetical protein DFH06DRAFT_71016 [Mycena polygramma]